MTKNNRTEQLHKIMQDLRLNSAEVGAILGRTAQTVRVWRSIHESRTIPADALKILELEAPAFAANRTEQN